MSETKFTKGPWRVRIDNDGLCWDVCAEDGARVVSAGYEGEVTVGIEDAHLIAAAPEQHGELERELAFLIEIIDRFDSYGDGAPDAGALAHDCLWIVDEAMKRKARIEKLLAKARGEEAT